MHGLGETKRIVIPYGALWQYELGTEVVINTIGVFELISGMSDGDDEGFIFQNDRELLVKEPGKYVINWNICFNNSNNTTWEAGVGINRTVQENTIGCRKLGAVDTGSMGGTGVITLEIDDIVTLEMANLTNTSNAVIDSCGLTLIKIASTD